MCGYFKCGQGNRLLDNLSMLSYYESMKETTTETATITTEAGAGVAAGAGTGTRSQASIRVEHYLRWIRKSIDFINENPSLNITITAYQQPHTSLVRSDMNRVVELYKDSLSFDVLSWIRCRELGG